MLVSRKSLYELSFGCLIMISAIILALLNSCQKTNKIIDGGISYGITGIEPLMAGSGDTVSVFGVGFASGTDDNDIVINGVAAKVVAASPQALRVIVPDAPRAGSITVKTGTKTYSYPGPFTPAIVIKGDQSSSLTLTSDKLYLLKGDVHLLTGAKLTIQAGCTILADKGSLASLTIDDGATMSMNGTAAKPIVFTSNQFAGQRNPGDWKGIILAGSSGSPADQISYARVEYAGYHMPGQAGAALAIHRAAGPGNIRYVQASYSSGDGFRSDAPDGTVEYLQYLVAFACAGNDFTFTGNTRSFGQFLLGLKDPAYADPQGADGLLVQSSLPVTVSNLTLVGYNGLARNANFRAPDQNSNYTPTVYDDVLNPAAGRGIHIGGTAIGSSTILGGSLQLFNGLVAAPWLAGISLDGPTAWSQFDDAVTGTIIRKTTFTYTLATSYNSTGHPANLNPFRGYVLSRENAGGPASGFEGVDMTGPQGTAFNQYNDSARLMMVYLPYTPPTEVYDDPGIRNMVIYSRITNPVMLPQAGSALLAGADFSDPLLNDTFFDRTVVFRGAFGTVDWTASWTNYVPQITAY